MLISGVHTIQSATWSRTLSTCAMTSKNTGMFQGFTCCTVGCLRTWSNWNLVSSSLREKCNHFHHRKWLENLMMNNFFKFIRDRYPPLKFPVLCNYQQWRLSRRGKKSCNHWPFSIKSLSTVTVIFFGHWPFGAAALLSLDFFSWLLQAGHRAPLTLCDPMMTTIARDIRLLMSFIVL